MELVQGIVTEDRETFFFKDDVKEFIKLLKANKRFKQLGGELRDELGLDDARIIQKIQLMFMEILLDIDKLAGKDLIINIREDK